MRANFRDSVPMQSLQSVQRVATWARWLRDISFPSDAYTPHYRRKEGLDINSVCR